MTSFNTSPFQPTGLLKSAHIQTIRGNLRPKGDLTYSRQRLETPDGDFIDLDTPIVRGYEQLNNDHTAPIVLALHGLGGSARRGYMCQFYREFAALGLRAIGMNYRGASEENNRKPQTYHSGATDDIAFVYNWIRTTYPDVPCGIVSISIGGVMLLNLLGQNRCDIPAAVAISPALNLSLSAKQLSASIYNRYLMAKLKEITQQKAHQLEGLVDVEKTLRTKTIYQFDEVCTAPLNGFKSAEDYYQKCSPDKSIHAITTPTLIIRALDDPFLDPADIPQKALNDNPYITAQITPYGGHVGFGDGSIFRPRWWAHEQGAQFLARHLKS